MQDSGYAPFRHTTNAWKCPPSLLLCLLYLWNCWGSALGWPIEAKMLCQVKIYQCILNNLSCNNLFIFSEKYLQEWINKPGFNLIPSLYYKPADGGEYICSGPDNQGIHKCSGASPHKCCLYHEL